ncbi:MAG: spore maturation protein A [Oscillospiraceae bacterium]|nr:spore maturation protein A [Oscillospiraceae bacterium]
MILSVVWALGMGASLLYACTVGTLPLLTAALTEGITAAVNFCMTTGAMMVFWCGIFSLMEDCGIAGALNRLLRPLLGRLFPVTAAHKEAFAPLCANVTANLLGLGNAATPMGIRGVRAMAKLPRAQHELGRLVVMNTASIQLLPTTVISLRAAMGSADPADILVPVLLTSLLSVTAGLVSLEVLQR